MSERINLVLAFVIDDDLRHQQQKTIPVLSAFDAKVKLQSLTTDELERLLARARK